MNTQKIGFEMIFSFQSFTNEDLVRRFGQLINDLFVTANEIMLYDQVVRKSQLLDVITNRTKTAFFITSLDSTIHRADVRNYDLTFVQIDGSGVDLNIARQWIESILAEDNFVVGRMFDSEFERWQNVITPEVFEAAGISIPQSKLISNGLPFPLECLIVDTSENPGRRVLREGVVEAIGAPMWLGQLFWQSSGATPEDVASREKVIELPNGVWEILSESSPFQSSTDETVDRMIELRRLLFPRFVSD